MKTLLNTLTIGFLILMCIEAQSQVMINEYSCSNMNTITDNYNEYEDWIELYNNSAATVSLAGYYLSDRPNAPMKWQIPAGVSISPNGFMMVFASKKNEFSGGNLHPSFKLTQTKLEHIVLSDPSGNPIDMVQTIPTQEDHSRGRETNGASTWALFTIPTPNQNNAGAKPNYTFSPVMNQDAGLYSGTIQVEISSPDPNVTIHYTNNGDEPTTASPQVTAPILVSATTVLRARAFSSNPDVPASFIETNTYFISNSHTLPVLSISGTQVDDLLGGLQGEMVGVMEYFDADQNLIDEAVGHFNKHGNDSWAYQQRGFDFIARDQMGYSHAIDHEIFRDTDRDSYQRLIVKAAANDNYPLAPGQGAHIRDAYVHSLSILGNLELDERTFEPCILYLNGEYWGVYDVREKADDHDYTNYYYDQDEYDIQYLKTWGGTWTEYGEPDADPAWQTLKDFIVNNDMTDPANYAQVEEQFNCLSLIDYVVLNSYVVCSDWLNWNTAWWRGMDPNGGAQKWRYVLWDMDATFGHYINYTGIPDVTAGADPCNPETLGDPGGQGHIPVLNALMNNEDFKQLYVNRFVDLSNTVFSCDYMHGLLDSLIDLIEPEMPEQIAKWGGTMAEWQQNVQDMKTFIDGRCIDLSDGMIDCYDLIGPFDIMVKVEPEGAGEVKINSLWFEEFPYFGTYYGEIDVLLKAEATGPADFDHWEFKNHTIYDGEQSLDLAINLLSTDTIVAWFAPPAPSVNLGADTTICEGTSILLDAGNEGMEIVWHDGSNQQTYTVSQAGTYSVKVTNAEFTDQDTITVEVLSAPWVSIDEDKKICPGEVATIKAYSDEDTLTWQDGSTGFTYDATEEGTYTVYAENMCGNAEASMNLTMGTIPDVNLGPDLNIEYGQEIILDATTSSASYQWQDNSSEPYFIVTEPGTYWVIVRNSCGSRFDDVVVEVITKIIIPEAITPNGDGLNDEFYIFGEGIIPESVHLQIFDKWGNQVFEGKNLHDRWDGTINSSKAPQCGIYPYILSYKTFDGQSECTNGTITVLK